MLPSDERVGSPVRDDHQRFAPEPYRDYLRLLARLWLPQRERRKLDASDLVQNAMLKAHGKGKQFDGDTVGQYKVWLRRILKNVLLDEVKNSDKSVQKVEDASRATEEHLAAVNPSPGSQVAKAESFELLAHTLSELPKEWQDVLTLHYLCELRVGRVAEELGRTRASVAGIIRRALERLRENARLRECFGED